MFKKRILRVSVFLLVLYFLGAIALAEISLHPLRVRRGDRLARLTTLAEHAAASSGSRLQNVSIQAGWYTVAGLVCAPHNLQWKHCSHAARCRR